MELTLDFATRGFVSSFEEEEYELAGLQSLTKSSYGSDEDEEEDDETGKTPDYPDNEDREIFDRENESYIRDYF